MTEEEIIKGCIQNNQQCQLALFKQYAGMIMGVCLRYASDAPEAEDMLQKSFIKVFAAIHQFRFEGPFEAWIRKLTVRTCLALLHKKRMHYADIAITETVVDHHALKPGCFCRTLFPLANKKHGE